MPPKVNPICVVCKNVESLLWRSADLGQICQECFEIREIKDKEFSEYKSAEINGDNKIKTNKEKDNKEVVTIENKNNIGEEKRLRKSTRTTRFKTKLNNANTNSSSEKTSSSGGSTKILCKGRNRRSLFKRTPFKTPLAQATTHSAQSVFHKGSYLQVGDIVSLVDGENNVYYAQIRGLLVDSYSEKSAYLTWLIPTQESPDPKDGFDAATYLIGPDEELSRKLSCLEFVMHAPSNYYLDRTTPFPLPDDMEYDTKPGGYIWTTLPEVHRNNSKEIY
uniref:GATA zinc finger domain-containing protein 1 n=1 Tax=Glossina brevipalpis TaxID=37001 RepID=A0A1A9X0P3_9MUSC